MAHKTVAAAFGRISAERAGKVAKLLKSRLFFSLSNCRYKSILFYYTFWSIIVGKLYFSLGEILNFPYVVTRISVDPARLLCRELATLLVHAHTSCRRRKKQFGF